MEIIQDETTNKKIIKYECKSCGHRGVHTLQEWRKDIVSYEMSCHNCGSIIALITLPQEFKIEEAAWDHLLPVYRLPRRIPYQVTTPCRKCGYATSHETNPNIHDGVYTECCDNCLEPIAYVRYEKEIKETNSMIRLTRNDKLIVNLQCPYCKTEQDVPLTTSNSRPVGLYRCCTHCDLVWRVEVNIKNHPIPDQQIEWHKMYKKGLR